MVQILVNMLHDIMDCMQPKYVATLHVPVLFSCSRAGGGGAYFGGLLLCSGGTVNLNVEHKFTVFPNRETSLEKRMHLFVIAYSLIGYCKKVYCAARGKIAKICIVQTHPFADGGYIFYDLERN